MTKALFVKTDGTILLINTPTELADIQALVGGPIEVIRVAAGEVPVHGYCHDEGKILGLPENFAASYLYGTPNDLLAGNVVFFGSGDPQDGYEHDIPDWFVEAVRMLFGLEE